MRDLMLEQFDSFGSRKKPALGYNFLRGQKKNAASSRDSHPSRQDLFFGHGQPGDENRLAEGANNLMLRALKY